MSRALVLYVSLSNVIIVDLLFTFDIFVDTFHTKQLFIYVHIRYINRFIYKIRDTARETFSSKHIIFLLVCLFNPIMIIAAFFSHQKDAVVVRPSRILLYNIVFPNGLSKQMLTKHLRKVITMLNLISTKIFREPQFTSTTTTFTTVKY